MSQTISDDPGDVLNTFDDAFTSLNEHGVDAPAEDLDGAIATLEELNEVAISHGNEGTETQQLIVETRDNLVTIAAGAGMPEDVEAAHDGLVELGSALLMMLIQQSAGP